MHHADSIERKGYKMPLLSLGPDCGKEGIAFSSVKSSTIDYIQGCHGTSFEPLSFVTYFDRTMALDGSRYCPRRIYTLGAHMNQTSMPLFETHRSVLGLRPTKLQPMTGPIDTNDKASGLGSPVYPTKCAPLESWRPCPYNSSKACEILLPCKQNRAKIEWLCSLICPVSCRLVK